MENEIKRQNLIKVSDETAILVCAKAKLDDVYNMVENVWKTRGEELSQNNNSIPDFDVFVDIWNKMNAFIVDSTKLTIICNLDNFNYTL